MTTWVPPLGQARPLEFLRTCYGGSFLVHESFLYKREKAVGDKVYWTCRDQALHGCRSRAITQGQRVTVMRGHCHQPDVEGLEARRQQEKAVETLQAGQDGPGSQVDTLLRGVDSLLYRRGPGPLTLTRSRPRKRAKVEDQELPAQPEAPDEHQDMDADPGELPSFGAHRPTALTLASRGPGREGGAIRPTQPLPPPLTAS